MRRHWADPAFRAAVLQARQGIVDAIHVEICKAARLAIATLEALLTSDDSWVRFKAAQVILTHALSYCPAAVEQ